MSMSKGSTLKPMLVGKVRKAVWQIRTQVLGSLSEVSFLSQNCPMQMKVSILITVILQTEMMRLSKWKTEGMWLGVTWEAQLYLLPWMYCHFHQSVSWRLHSHFSKTSCSKTAWLSMAQYSLSLGMRTNRVLLRLSLSGRHQMQTSVDFPWRGSLIIGFIILLSPDDMQISARKARDCNYRALMWSHSHFGPAIVLIMWHPHCRKCQEGLSF